jgi:hypothetical protein
LKFLGSIGPVDRVVGQAQHLALAQPEDEDRDVGGIQRIAASPRRLQKNLRASSVLHELRRAGRAAGSRRCTTRSPVTDVTADARAAETVSIARAGGETPAGPTIAPQ